MTLRHMRIFVAVCEYSSITLAAQKLYLAQPAVSLAIRELEDNYGIQLFDRISRRLYITEAGKRFLSYATHMISLFDEMETEIKNWDSFGTLKIGTSITIGTYLISYYLKEFSKQFPDVEVSVVIDNSEKIEAKILSNELDFGLIEGIVHSPFIVSQEFKDDHLVFICSPNHPFAQRKTVSLDELETEAFLLRESGSGTREIVDSLFTSYGVSISPIWESISTRAIINGVAEEIGVSILPQLLVQRELEEGFICSVPIQDAELSRKFHVIYHKNKYLTKSAHSFISICK